MTEWAHQLIATGRAQLKCHFWVEHQLIQRNRVGRGFTDLDMPEDVYVRCLI